MIYAIPQDGAKNIQRYLEFLLGPLLGQGHEADNLSMLLQMVDTIVTSYQDALEPSNDRIHITARVARQVRGYAVLCVVVLSEGFKARLFFSYLTSFSTISCTISVPFPRSMFDYLHRSS